MEKNFKILVSYPKKDFTGYEKEHRHITIKHTEITEYTKDIYFSLVLPDYIFDRIKDTAKEYAVTPPKEYHDRLGFKKFTKTRSSVLLSSLIEEFNTICRQAVEKQIALDSPKEKLIAIDFFQDSAQKKSGLNHADMGIKTQSSFQWFVVYKAYKKTVYSDRKTPEYMSNKCINDNPRVDREWFYHHIDGEHRLIEDNFKLIPWTQEREDFLTLIQGKLKDVFEELDKFLGDLDESKLQLLMENNNLKLLT